MNLNSNLLDCAKDASGNEIDFVGEFTAIIKFKDDIKSGTIFTANVENLNIFGVDLIEKFNLWDAPKNSFCNPIVNLVKSNTYTNEIEKIKLQFPQVFQKSTGHCDKVKINLETSDQWHMPH